jgi:hypothetical protein
MRSLLRPSICVAATVAAYACGVGAGPPRLEAAELPRGATGPLLRVTILGAPDDPRVPACAPR